MEIEILGSEVYVQFCESEQFTRPTYVANNGPVRLTQPGGL